MTIPHREDAQATPDPHLALIADLLAEKEQLVAYLLLKVKAGDMHAVADAAMDIRELNAKLEILNL